MSASWSRWHRSAAPGRDWLPDWVAEHENDGEKEHFTHTCIHAEEDMYCSSLFFSSLSFFALFQSSTNILLKKGKKNTYTHTYICDGLSLHAHGCQKGAERVQRAIYLKPLILCSILPPTANPSCTIRNHTLKECQLLSRCALPLFLFLFLGQRIALMRK